MLLHYKNANSSIWYQYNMRKMDKIEKKEKTKSLTTTLVVFSHLKFTPFAVSFMFLLQCLLQCLFLSTQLLSSNSKEQQLRNK